MTITRNNLAAVILVLLARTSFAAEHSTDIYAKARSASQTSALLCRSLQYALVEAPADQMSAFAVNNFSPWVKSQPNAFPKGALTHPLLGNDLATYLPTPRSFLELRTFVLGTANAAESNALCNYYDTKTKELYKVQQDAMAKSTHMLVESEANAVSVKIANRILSRGLQSFDYHGRNRSRQVLQDLNVESLEALSQRLAPTNVSLAFDIANEYKSRNLYVPGPGATTTNYGKELYDSKFGDFAKRNIYWQKTIIAPFDDLSDGNHASSQVPWEFLNLSEWPLHSRRGSGYLDVKERAQALVGDFLLRFRPEIDDPRQSAGSLHPYWFALFGKKLQYVTRGTIREDSRNDRFKNFLRILVAELIHSHYIAIPKQIKSLRDQWTRHFAWRKELAATFADKSDAEIRALAQEKYNGLLQEVSDEKLESAIRHQMFLKMKERNFSPEKIARVFKVFNDRRSEILARYTEGQK